MIKTIRNIYQKYKKNRIINYLSEKVTLLGSSYEFTESVFIRTLWGATKKNIIFKDDVSILGADITCGHNGFLYLGNHVKLQRNITIHCVNNIEIGDYTAIAPNVVITDNDSHPINPDFRKFMRVTPHGSDARSWIHAGQAPVKIGQNCWIGQNARIQKGVTIGDNSIIAANSVVTKSVPSNCIAAGNPAKIVKTDIDKIPAPKSCAEYNKYVEENGTRV